jgi:hypothetical protein
MHRLPAEMSTAMEEQECLWTPTPGFVPRHAAPDWLDKLDWVFGDNASTGEVASGERDSRFNGKPIPYQKGQSWVGVRFRTERNLATAPQVGFRVEVQAGMSRMIMRIKGIPSSASIVVIPPDQLGDAFDLVSSWLAESKDSKQGVAEWATGSLLVDGEFRPALRLVSINCAGNYEQILRKLSEKVDVECVMLISAGVTCYGRVPTQDRCTIYGPDGQWITELPGGTFLEPAAPYDHWREVALSARKNRHGNA